MLNRPGFHTSEFAVALVTAVSTILNASEHWVSWQQAALAVLAGISYIVSRGLAKTESRNPPAPPVPPAA